MMGDKLTSNSKGVVADAIKTDFALMLDGMKGLENMGKALGVMNDVNNMTPGQLYDETYRRILKNAITRFTKKLEEFN